MQAENIEHVSDVGLGTMGHGIAQTFAVAGFPHPERPRQSSSRSRTLMP